MAKTLKLGPKAKVIDLKPITTLQKLVDELGTVHEQFKMLASKEKELKDAVKRLGPGVFDGLVFIATSEQRTRTTHKTELLRAKIDAALLKECEVTSAYLEVKTVRRTPKLNLT